MFFSFHLVSSQSINTRVEFGWKSGEKGIKTQKLMINLSLFIAYEIAQLTLNIPFSTLRVYLNEMSRKKSFRKESKSISDCKHFMSLRAIFGVNILRLSTTTSSFLERKTFFISEFSNSIERKST